jgi:hypothetical protein
LPGWSKLIGFGEKLFAMRARSAPIVRPTSGTFVPSSTDAPPLSTTVTAPTKPIASCTRRWVSERFVPASSRSSPVSRRSSRPQMPPVALTMFT